MARTRIGSKLIAVGGVHKDNIQSGSIEIKHLDFGFTAAADYLVDLRMLISSLLEMRQTQLQCVA